MTPEAKEKLLLNLSALPKMASAWIMSAAGVLATVWFALPPEQQMALVEHSYLPPWSYPIALTALGIIARVWPQKSLSAREAAAKSDAP